MKVQTLLTVMILLVPIMADSQERNEGITPDSFLWGIDVALDKISLALTSNPESRAEKALEIAQERLMEVKAMVEANKVEAAAKAEIEHSITLEGLIESVEALSDDDDPEGQIEKELELETKIKAHEEKVKIVKTELKIKIKIEGELSSEQQQLLDQFLESLSNNTREVKIKIKNKRDETEIKIQEKTGESEIEIRERIHDLELKKGLLEEKIELEGKIIGNMTFVKLELEYDSEKINESEVLAEFLEKFAFDTEKADLLLELEEGDELGEEEFRVRVEIEDEGSEIESRLRFIVASTERSEIINAIVERTSLTLSDVEAVLKMKNKLSEEDPELEIEVETYRNRSRVKIKIDDEKTKFQLDTANHEEILIAIASRLGLDVEEIRDLVEFEDEDEKEDEDLNDAEDQEDEAEDTGKNKTNSGDETQTEGDNEEDGEDTVGDNEEASEEDESGSENNTEVLGSENNTEVV
ncbi:MAG: hypothetical protein GOV00_04285 [Candidatus Altiarchaeota archaeon]|nr:hypothetical protein [Candidatus Altiarchaeota archaeon]